MFPHFSVIIHTDREFCDVPFPGTPLGPTALLTGSFLPIWILLLYPRRPWVISLSNSQRELQVWGTPPGLQLGGLTAGGRGPPGGPEREIQPPIWAVHGAAIRAVGRNECMKKMQNKVEENRH